MSSIRKLPVMSAVIVAWAVAGCSMNKTALKNNSGASAASAAANGSSTEEPSVRNDLLREVPEVQAVHFSYDSADLDAQNRDLLKKNAAWLRDHRGYKLQVAGNCDERGTEEYNLALGERRATAVRKYYRLLGIAYHRMATISYGKDRPLCKDNTDSCWAENRRAETMVASPMNLSKAPASANP